MAGMSVDGLISGLDTTSLISQLVQAEGAPQAQLKTRLSVTQAAATAYRTINTRFDAVRTAAEALTADKLAAARTAKSSDSSVSATAGTSATNGAGVTFAVTALASTASQVSTSVWPSATTPVRDREPAWPIELQRPDGTLIGTVDVKAGGTLEDAAAAINDEDLGVRATVQRVNGGYTLLLTSESSGLAGDFRVKSATETGATAGSGFREISAARDAEIELGGGHLLSSSTNTFADVITGVSVTVTKADPTTQVTVSVGSDPAATAAKVKSLVDAVNNALSGIKTYTAANGGATAVLKGDSALMSLSSRLLTAVSDAVGADGSPYGAGIRLEKNGTVVFEQDKFIKALETDPELAQRLVAGTPAVGTTAAVPGVAQRVLDLARTATDTTTGTLVTLAQGRDRLAKDIESRIAAWDLRLVQRRETLTRQFTAMETALSSMKNQSTWLAGQLNSLSSSS